MIYCLHRVKLVVNKSTGEAVAMKMIDIEKHPDARQAVRKETAIHRMLSNSNVIQYFGKRSEPNMEYIFLEYASGGELFDRIGKIELKLVKVQLMLLICKFVILDRLICDFFYSQI